MDIKISCPKCGHNFNLRAANPAALMSKNFNCPKCGGSTPFAPLLRRAGVRVQPSAPPMGGPAPLRTHLAGGAPGVSGGGTQMAMPGVASGGTQMAVPGAGIGGAFSDPRIAQRKPVLKVIETGRLFPLAVGQFILGRDSADSRATLRLAPDPYMSRSHAHLSVSYGATGMVKLVLTPMNSQNVVYVNGARISAGASVELHPGDEILLGMTNITYIER